MDDGFYWISFQGIVQIAFLSNEPVEDIDRESPRLASGF
jgi:hypothetical protein